ncbi:hypothetical protein [Mucilaginibacter sp. UR6-11]|uniref:hypothetical protein n=1 Tax=Mucilaginibacter sp. UR6-11 TaxID=1435644 RepID=UPI001E38F905|nr:hypothetical protein [Mucilaginibacter sp. UR6-11]MCC8427225.1 hypothetical protein [Mucilaginibacter sp. UR6-11]
MNDIQLYINDQLVDLSDDSPIALTFQINNLAEVKNQQGNTSNQFKLPLTQRNRQILGFPDDLAFCTNLPYTQYPAKLVQDGLEIIPYGVGELNGIDQDTASITILSGNVDFFDAIDGSLYEMGDGTSQWGKELLWKQYDHEWTLNTVAYSQTRTDGWIYPVVDYGNFTEDYSAPINVTTMRPGFFIKTAIDLLVKSAGYKATGSLLSDPLYPKLIAQFSNSSWEHGTAYQTQPDLLSCSAATGSVIQLNHPNNSNPTGRFVFDNKLADPSGQLSNGVFTAAQRSDFTITVNFPKTKMYGRITGKHPTYLHVTITVHTPGLPDIYPAELNFTWDMGNWVRDAGTSGGSITGYVDIGKQALSCQTELAAGQSVEVNYTWLGDNPSYFTVGTGATFTVQAQNRVVKYSQPVQCERIFPDISQKDLLKDTLQRFGIICQTDNATKTISFNSFHDIVNNIPLAKNWTKKCLDQGKTISFQLGGYAQANTMKYKQDDAVLPAGFADAVINVADTTLPATTDLLESQFASTLNRPYIGGTVAQIKMIDTDNGGTDFSIGVSPRILIDHKLNLTQLNKSVIFTDGGSNHITVNDIISTPYFYKPDGDYSLCFGDMPGTVATKPLPGLKTKYYPELEKILKQTKKIVRYFLLTPRDILELDLLIPVYLEQDGAYYYINKIDAWRKGQPTKVELVKLG